MSARARLGVLLAVGFLVRAVAIDADPPRWHQLGFICDEGWWAHNGRNRALFGTFVLQEPRDDFNQGLWISPVFTVLCWGSFSLLGPSLQSLRLVSALAAVVTAAALARVAGRLVSPAAAPLAALLYLFSPFVWAFGRVGLVEETMNAFVAAALALWVEGTLTTALLAGIAHAAAFGTKSYALVAGIGIAVDGLLSRPAEGTPTSALARLGRLGAYAGGLAVGLLVWHLAVNRHHATEIAELNLKLSQDNFPSGAAAAVRNAFELPFERSGPEPGVAPWLLLAPVPAALLALAAATAIAAGGAAARPERALALATPVLLAYLALLAPMSQKPDRRYAVLLIPEVLLACWGDARARRLDWGAIPRGRLVAAVLPVVLLLAVPLAAIATRSRNAAVVGLAIAAALLWGVAAMVPARVLAALRFLCARPGAATLGIFAAVVGLEASRLSFTLRDEGRAIAAIVREDLVLGGVADTLLLESRARTFNDMRKGSGGRFNGDLRVRANVPWLVTWTQPERLAMPDDPRVTAGATKIRETPVLPVGAGHRATVLLWRTGPAATAPARSAAP